VSRPTTSGTSSRRSRSRANAPAPRDRSEYQIPIPEITNSSGMPQVAPKAMNTVTTRFSAAAFSGNSPAAKMTAVWKSTNPTTTTSARSRSSSP